MATASDYKNFVVAKHYVLGTLDAKRHFSNPPWNRGPWHDCAAYWSMAPCFLTPWSQRWGYWYIGYTTCGAEEVGRVHIAYDNGPAYWWCRKGDWLPLWGNLTKRRAELTKEMRDYWIRKWQDVIIPQIKDVLRETTNLPDDIINTIPNYFEYPFEAHPIRCGASRA